MPKVKARATMYVELQWIGNIPDDVPEDDYYMWVKHNVDGDSYSECCPNDWELHWVEKEES